MEVELHSFLTSALEAGELSPSSLTVWEREHDVHWIGCWVGLDILEWRKMSSNWRLSNPDPSVAQAVIPCDTSRSSDITNRLLSVTSVLFLFLCRQTVFLRSIQMSFDPKILLCYFSTWHITIRLAYVELKHSPWEEVFVNSEWCVSFSTCRGLPKWFSEGRLGLACGIAVMHKETVIGAIILRIDGRIGGEYIYIYIYIVIPRLTSDPANECFG